MVEEVSIIEINPSWRRGFEDMGSKPKFWFRYLDAMWLFKQARVNEINEVELVTGEHWAEKVASEIAEKFGLRTHQVELAQTHDGVRGCAVKSFLKKGQSLIHGNELLAGAVEGYDKTKERGQSDHNFDNIVAALEHHFPPPYGRTKIAHKFVGYLVFDALVGNTDRHHENWGATQLIETVDDRENKRLSLSIVFGLAPTFDHGSSLGREMLDERRRMILDDKHGLSRYIRKAKGGIFRNADQQKGMSPIDLVRLIAKEYPAFFKPWQERVTALESNFAHNIISRIPNDWMSETSKEFSLALLSENRKLITSIK